MAVDSGNRRVYSFKSVGVGIESFNKSRPGENEKPIGIKTPLQLGADNSGLLRMHKSLADQVHDKESAYMTLGVI
jgi:hypothetical protein